MWAQHFDWYHFQPPTSTLTPQNEASNLRGLSVSCHWNSSQTGADGPKASSRGIAKSNVGGLSISTTPIPLTLQNWGSQSSPSNYGQTVADGIDVPMSVGKSWVSFRLPLVVMGQPFFVTVHISKRPITISLFIARLFNIPWCDLALLSLVRPSANCLHCWLHLSIPNQNVWNIPGRWRSIVEFQSIYTSSRGLTIVSGDHHDDQIEVDLSSHTG